AAAPSGTAARRARRFAARFDSGRGRGALRRPPHARRHHDGRDHAHHRQLAHRAPAGGRVTIWIAAGIASALAIVAMAALAIKKGVAAERSRRIVNQLLAMEAALAGFTEHAIEAASVEQVVEAIIGPLAAGVDVRRLVLLRRIGGEWMAQQAPGGAMVDPPPP